MRKKVLITGSNGQLGQCLQQRKVGFPELDITFVDRSSLMLDEADRIEKYFSSNKFNWCINCAAYTAVDKAESEYQKAFAVNAIGAGKLAEVCENNGIRLIHMSTDYVFKGNATQPYKETERTDPVNLYGLSKLEGERLIQKASPGSLIIRTSWLYSEYGNNFVKTMVRLMKEREVLSVVNDQIGSPTYAGDLAEVLFKIVVNDNPAAGVYHYSNKGIISWYDFAVSIGKVIETSCKIVPITSEQYPTPAARPAYSAFDTSKIESTFNIEIPLWYESLQACIIKLKSLKN